MVRCVNELDSSFKKQESVDSYRCTTTLDTTESSDLISALYSSENYSASDEDRENENPDQPRAVKRKNSSSDVGNERSKILKKESVPESANITGSTPLTPVTPSANENNDLLDVDTTMKNTLTKDYFSILPDEVLLLIFKAIQFKPALVNCACVCRRWKNVAFDADLWFRIDLSQRTIEPGIMEEVLCKKPVVLKMSQTKVVTPMLKNVDDASPNLLSKIEYLDLSMASISPNELEILLRTCHNLVKLSLEFVGLSEGVCKEISKNSKLSVLNLAQAGNLNDTSLKIILTNCLKLNELNVAWTSLNASAIKCLCQYVSKDIDRLNLSGCVKEITDSHVATLALRCNKLKELDLSDATGITDGSIHSICDNLNKLEIISLSRCYNINPASYSKLFRLPSIAHINIFGLFTDAQVETLRKSTNVELNKMKFSYTARPTVGSRRTSVWGLRVRD
ncbi:hypothetical protein V9T40_003507 [Parthenolecanium corni]|uniref:F-box domain-containing protein n=1 Tax=Parthenolecanium corni TaxID=536013 RepID=A0AAN9TSV1_9HEMI